MAITEVKINASVGRFRNIGLKVTPVVGLPSLVVPAQTGSIGLSGGFRQGSFPPKDFKNARLS